ncbi:redoxin domain-containing protein [Parapedobacter indicus]|uniref:redoxin domain-containing protein n=1 Tax=Parapedobacter indicus TaxID=1477437 RepID=UPI001C672153
MALVLLASQDKTQIGQIAPDFRQQTPKGDTIRLSDFRGKYLLLDFWLVGAVLDGGKSKSGQSL